MRQIKTFSDFRLDKMCSFCGEIPDTRDHIPSKILLDEPFPENLPIVPCCDKCNKSFSLDEEYIACILECVICGTTKIEQLNREKIKRILERKKALHKKIMDSTVELNGQISFNVDVKRLKNVILKLAKGHAKYENSQPILEEPIHFGFKPLHTMTNEDVDFFMINAELTKSPEVGSRAMQNFLIDTENNVQTHWTIVQPDNYSYCVINSFDRICVKIIVLNYLAIEIIWSN